MAYCWCEFTKQRERYWIERNGGRRRLIYIDRSNSPSGFTWYDMRNENDIAENENEKYMKKVHKEIKSTNPSESV